MGKYKSLLSNKAWIKSAIGAIIIFTLSLFFNAFTGNYADKSESNPVTDIVLSNIRAYDVDWFFLYGILFFAIFIVTWCFMYPWQMPFIIKSLALFIIIRWIFMSLTHIGMFPSSIPIDQSWPVWFIGRLNFGADLFFSGHTGMPFLMALIFWDRKYLRYLFLVASLFFGTIVLLGHLHYSIDVLAAFFITYSIYHICELFFKKDKIHFLAIK